MMIMTCEIIKRIKEEIERDRELKTLRRFKEVLIAVVPTLSKGVLADIETKDNSPS